MPYRLMAVNLDSRSASAPAKRSVRSRVDCLADSATMFAYSLVFSPVLRAFKARLPATPVWQVAGEYFQKALATGSRFPPCLRRRHRLGGRRELRLHTEVLSWARAKTPISNGYRSLIA